MLRRFFWRGGGNSRGWRGCVIAAGLSVLLGHAAWAQPMPGGNAPADPTIAEAEQFSLDQPSHLTPRALSGLFTSVALAGSRLVAVGERGRVIISDNNGASWRQVETPTSVTLTNVAFATKLDGWAVGGMGLVLHSKDGGLTWTRQFDGARAATVALAAAQADIKQSGSNANTTANLQAAQATAAAGPSVPLLNVYATTPRDVMIAGGFGMAFASSDAGDSWQSLADFLPNPNGLHIYQMRQDGKNLAVVGEQGLVLYGPPGKPLATLSTPFQGTFFGEIFTRDHTWIAFGLQGTILRSADQGAHWATIQAGEPVGIDCGIVLADGDVLLGNIAGQLLRSHDDGQSFTVTSVGEPVVGVAQAADGAVIVAGPSGTLLVSRASLAAGA